MSTEMRRQLRRLEGTDVSLALSDGSRLDDVSLVSARGSTLWIFDGGRDVFVPVSKVLDVWPSQRARSAA
jgi:hypothetical protein